MRYTICVAVLAFLFPLGVGQAQSTIDLAGEWSLALDGNDLGVRARWFSTDSAAPYSRTVAFPGSLAVQGVGDRVTIDTPWVGDWEISGYRSSPKYAAYRTPNEVKLPFWLTPTTYYSGPAWYRREIEVPRNWAGKRVLLSLERCHWTTTVWLDGKELGRGEALATPHEFDLTSAATPGKHELVIRVDNRQLLNVGPNSHSVSDHTQGNWNGVIGKIELRATPKVWIKQVQLYPNVQDKSVTAKIKLGNISGQVANGKLMLQVRRRGELDAKPFHVVATQSVDNSGTDATLKCELGGDCQFWNEFNPAIYTATAEWQPDGLKELNSHTATADFGMREVGVEGTQITINGQPVYLRGTLDCCVFPLTGHPPMDVASWRRILRTCKDFGLNHVRFHSYCPPEAAFVAADELGMYLQVECSSWGNQGAKVGSGQPLDRFLYREAERILATYGNHPSFVLLAYGNEPGGENQNAFLTEWIKHFRLLDDRHLYSGGSGWPDIPANEFFVALQPRIQGWGQQLKSRINARPPESTTDYRQFVKQHTMPIISHEIGQWCVYPNFREADKYTGHLKAKNFEIFAELLEPTGMSGQAHQFVMASGALQVLCYKEEIESALRTPGFGGFQLLGLSDFSGQGTALVGVLNAFWEAKEYVTAADFRRFCGPIVPLARMSKRTFVNSETYRAELELYNFGPEDLEPATLEWKLLNMSDGSTFASGTVSASAPKGRLSSIGSIQVSLRDCKGPSPLKLVVRVSEAEVENDWDVWVYPAQPEIAKNEVYVTSQWDQQAKDRLQAGGKVLLALAPGQVKTDQQLGFSSIFWNTAWTEGQAPHTLGILCNPNLPVFDSFPTDEHSNWQWWELINGGAAMDLTDRCPQIEPLVQVVPDWVNPRRLALMFEARVGPGKLMVMSANIHTDQERRPAARQFRTSVLNYMSSDEFAPQTSLDEDQIGSLLNSSPDGA